jgi:Na+/melibiose symporter-like transporter
MIGGTGAAAGARAPRQVGAFSLRDQIYVSLLWFALFANWLTVVPVILPDQVSTILGPDTALKEGISGTILALGALIALVLAPVAGSLSDRLRSAGGRRRPFLIAGMAGTCLGLALLIPFGAGSSILLYAIAFLNLQFWWNWTCGPYAGLIPDVVPERDQASASAWMNIMSVLGTMAGNGTAFALYVHGHPGPAIIALIILNLACLLLTLKGVREPPAPGADRAFELGSFLRSFWLTPNAHRNFYWVLVTRLFANMGVWSVLTFLLFYLQDVIGITEPDRVLPMLLAAGALLGIPASLIAARMAGNYGIVQIVRTTAWMMAVSAICYVLIAFRPEITLLLPVGLVFFAGWGAYQAMDWALALRVLPKSETAGKDMGIWHIALVLPQILGPAATGWIITGAKIAVSARFAYTIAFGVAAFWFILSAALIGRVRLALAV